MVYATFAEELPFELTAFVGVTVGKLHINKTTPPTLGELSIQFFPSDTRQLHGEQLVQRPQRLKLQQLLAVVPKDFPVRAIKASQILEHDAPLVYKSLKQTVVCMLNGELPTVEKPFGYRLIHEARILHEIKLGLEQRGLRGQHPNIPEVHAVGTLTLDEIPASEGQERIYSIVKTLQYTETLGDRIQRWQQHRDRSAILSTNDINKILRGVRKALDDLHSLDIGYNEVGPEAIGLTSDLTPVLTDFHACAKFGTNLQTSENLTHGLIGLFNICVPSSTKDNDDEAFSHLSTFLHKVYDMPGFAPAA